MMKTAEYYHALADETRARADMFTTIECRSGMFSVADGYDRIGRLLEQNKELSAMRTLHNVKKWKENGRNHHR